MDKKYQVFISSTYLDMKDERQTAVEAILDAGHIPAGMELFAATDRAQLDVIKNWIDRSDIFMLVLGGRYGSVEPESGKSYIHLEYEYAVETGKPFFALYLTDKAINEKVKLLGTDAIERSDTKKLNEFRALVKSRLCSEINDAKDIHRHVQKSIRSVAEDRKLEGWLRATQIPDYSPLIDKLAALQSEHGDLKSALQRAKQENALLLEKLELALRDTQASKASPPDVVPKISAADLDLSMSLEVELKKPGLFTKSETWDVTCREMFALLYPCLLEEPTDLKLSDHLTALLRDMPKFAGSDAIGHASLSNRSFMSMKVKFIKVGLLVPTQRFGTLRWSVTESGRELAKMFHGRR